MRICINNDICLTLMKICFKNRTLTFLVCLVALFNSCIDESIYSGSTLLKFSKDTVLFDTIFTRQPGSIYPISVTKIISVKNTENAWVKANFNLGGGIKSPYKMNIDGVAGKEIKNLEIGPQDSVFVFIQCALEANNQINPALILDSLIATVGQTSSKVMLAAYGWDAHYLKDSIIPNNTNWTDTKKPYVIIGNILVLENNTFNISEGVQVYTSAAQPNRFTGILIQGNFKVNGSESKRVTFKGDKPVFATKTLPNQWGGIYFFPGAKGNFKYAEITNAIIGIRADSIGNGANPTVELEQCKIQYCGQACLIGVTSNIKATNCLFADAGSYTFLAFLGGTYAFNHCTFAEYSGYTSRQKGHFAITNTQRNENGVLLNSKPLTTSIYNSIIYGGSFDEVYIDKVPNTAFNVTSESNIIKFTNTDKFFDPTINFINKKPKFIDISIGNYALDTLSDAIGKAQVSSPAVTIDINGKQRKSIPDLGAYER